MANMISETYREKRFLVTLIITINELMKQMDYKQRYQLDDIYQKAVEHQEKKTNTQIEKMLIDLWLIWDENRESEF